MGLAAFTKASMSDRKNTALTMRAMARAFEVAASEVMTSR
jgi:hypothetical protein